LGPELRSEVAVDACKFELLNTDASGARRGRMTLKHGVVETPVFMPVGTAATVKGLHQNELEEQLDAKIILANTYHLYLRPSHELIREQGGLHKFMSWPRNLLTDSGGYQVFSLSERRKIKEEGVEFRSHLDGSKHLITPEKSIEIQQALGSDIMMAFDHCPASEASDQDLRQAMERTTRWLTRCVAQAGREESGALFGIVQGGLSRELRREHAAELCEFNLPGYAVGGLALGESPERMHEIAGFTANLLPEDKPRYLMGVGFPQDLLAGIEGGIDLFDCVLPTRCARNGLLFTSRGRLPIRNARWAKDPRPVDPSCDCLCCRRYSRAYLRHLCHSGEMTGGVLSTLHNLSFYGNLMRKARAAIETGRFAAFKSETLAEMQIGPTEV